MAKGVKTGGRRKGVPNKRLAAEGILSTLQGKFPGYDPLIALAEYAHDNELPVELRERCHRELATYIHPKRKPVDEAGDSRDHVVLNFPSAVAKL